MILKLVPHCVLDQVEEVFSVTTGFILPAASTERPNGCSASEGALQFSAPSAPAFPAEGHADETEHGRRSSWDCGAHRQCKGPKRPSHHISTAVQLPTRVQPNDGKPPYLTKSLQPHVWGSSRKQTVSQSSPEQPDDGRRSGPVRQQRKLLIAARPVSAVWRVW